MPVTRSSPAGLMAPTPYAHVTVATGTRQVFVAGQVARTERGEPLAPGDLAGQVAAALRNTATALHGVGARFDDVVRLTFYVTDWTPEKIGDFMLGADTVAQEIGLSTPWPPSSLIGVQYLWEPDVLVEVEATAIID